MSLAGSPYHPVEDPAAAVVFGGSPERVLETIVDGNTRYRKEERGPAVARGTQHRKRRPRAECSHVHRVAGRVRTSRSRPSGRRSSSSSGSGCTRSGYSCCWPSSSRSASSFFGVGSGSTGITRRAPERLQLRSSGGSSISSLQNKVDKHPNDPTDWRNLATALEQKQRTQDAVTALEHYTTLRPRDQGALAELASQYGTLATNYSNDYAAAQQQMAEQESPASAFGPPSSTPFGKALANSRALRNPIAAAVATLAATRQQTAYSSYQSAQRNAESAYQRLVVLNPNDATSQIQLGQAAQAAQDPTAAIKAFTAFLKLAPTDPLAPQVKQALQALKDQAASGAGTVTAG